MTTAPAISGESHKPRTFNGDLAHLPAALLPLTESKRWVIWKWEQRANGKWTKPPYNPRFHNQSAKSNDPSTWRTYEDAVLAFSQGLCDGIGLMLKDGEVAAIDLDHIRDFATGQVLKWAEELFAEAAQAGCYVEWTVSGTGARIIGVAHGSELHKKIAVHRKNGCAVEFYRNTARFITVSGAQISGDYPGLPVPTALPEFDALFDALYSRFCDDARRPLPGACEFFGGPVISIEEIEEDEPPKNIFDFNNAGPQEPVTDYGDLIEEGAPEGERSEEFQRTVWHLAAQGKSAEEIAEELEEHPAGIGAKYAGRLLAEVQRSYGKWQQYRQAGATGKAATGTSWPQIKVVAGELPRIVDEAERALLLLGREFYSRGGQIVRPVFKKVKASGDCEFESWQLVPVTRHYMLKAFSCAARFVKYDSRRNAFVQVNVPNDVADVYLAQVGEWKLPELAGIANAPFLRADGSIHEQEGYDPVSGLLCKWQGVHFPPVPPAPDEAAAQAALEKLEAPLAEFPFEAPADKSVILAAMLSAIDRRNMRTSPLYGLSAPSARTGKSLLGDIVATIATGNPAVIINQEVKQEEFEKDFKAKLIAGHSIFTIDNCDRILQGALLCKALTQPMIDIRSFGTLKEVVTIFNNATVFANGNGLVMAGDLAKRSLMCVLDAGIERPEEREFKDNDLLNTVSNQRGELVCAALTVLRAWHIARPSIGLSLSRFGGFEDWSERVRKVLVWLGRADPCDTRKAIREIDPDEVELSIVLAEWYDAFGMNAKKVSDVIARALNRPDFYIALMNVAPSNNGSSVSHQRLGRWLVEHKKRIAGGLRLVYVGRATGNYPLWQVVKA
jgi:hypothetical protein